jgi:predicted DNA-binding ribbon-helix-helix protein
MTKLKPSPAKLAGLQKRSMALDGHRTSLALEVEFWAVLDGLAQARGMALSSLVAEIDHARAAHTPERPLASAVRVYALTMAQAARHPT